MSKIKIKNFGPIKEGYQENDGWIDVKKVTVFIGNQASGKSTAAKAIASLVWLEKALNRGDISENRVNTLNFFHKLFNHLRIGDEYFRKDTQIMYKGDLYEFIYDPQDLSSMVKRVEEKNYVVPKIMYVPSERTFLSVVRGAYDVKGLPPALFEFAEEFRRSQIELNGKSLQLPIKGYEHRYDQDDDKSFIIGKDHSVDLLEASSGFQSLVPLFVVTSNLANKIKSESKTPVSELSVDQSIRMSQEITDVLRDETISHEEKVKKAMTIQARFKNEAFTNIVEEPEQNLFPSSQHSMLNSLIEFNNLTDENRLVITTHSPYLINYLTLAVKAEMVKSNLTSKDSKKKLAEIVPLESTVKAEDLVIYEMDEKNGTIKKLENYKGLPSDENELNSELEETNELFAQLQEIEKGWR